MGAVRSADGLRFTQVAKLCPLQAGAIRPLRPRRESWTALEQRAMLARVKGALLVGLLGLLGQLVACGGSTPPPASPPPPPPPAAGAPQSDEPAASKEAPAQAPAPVVESTVSPAPQPAAAPPSRAQSAPAGSEGWDKKNRRAEVTGARAEFERAARDLEASVSDCAAACRALASMERAAGHLCDLEQGETDRTRCEDARTKVIRARESVRNACGGCGH